MATIVISDFLVGRNYPDAGKEVYKVMVELLSTNDKVVLNLEGVNTLPSMFLNTSIGQYIDDFGVKSMKQRVGFAKISTSQIERIKDYISKIAPNESIE